MYEHARSGGSATRSRINLEIAKSPHAVTYIERGAKRPVSIYLTAHDTTDNVHDIVFDLVGERGTKHGQKVALKMHRRILHPWYHSHPLAICRYGGFCLTNFDQIMTSNDANDATDIGFFDLPVERRSARERDPDHTMDKRIPRPRRPPTGSPDLPVDQGNVYKSTHECDVKRRV